MDNIKELDGKLVIARDVYIADWRADGVATLLKIMTSQNPQ